MYSVVGEPARVALRNRCSTRIGSPHGIPIYLVSCDQDPSMGTSVVVEMNKLLQSDSVLWTARMQRFLHSIMIDDEVATSQFFLSDRCCVVNPWNVVRNSDAYSAPILLAGSVISCACQAMLSEGRFGYLGMHYQRVLGLRSEVRFLRKFSSGKNREMILAAMSLYTKKLDEIRPGRPSLHDIFKLELINQK